MSAMNLNQFCPVSLGECIEFCKVGCVPYAPWEQVSEIRSDDYLNWTDEGAVRNRLLTPKPHT